MNAKRAVAVSKFLSKYLRHAPESLGLKLEPGGWVLVDSLLAACEKKDFPVTRAELEQVVAGSDKQRFSIDETGTKIRANQGHSVDVDLQLESVSPPAVLYHGTGGSARESIQKNGLMKMSRHHVHLSADVETAVMVGTRHGKPIVFCVDALRMFEEGHVFYCSENDVWLVDHVPPQYLSVMEK
jgi:putative RNA 2'-phosphotransferase